MKKTKSYTFIDLFAGAGGLALGLEQAGFEEIGLIEFDKDAADTLRINRPEWNVICDDIANISCKNLEEYFSIKKGELDLLSGGAPCQSFSYAGKRLGLEDARGTLFYHYAKFLEQLQPKMFLFENVRGLLTHDGGKTYRTITEIFESQGYTIHKKVLNAWDYGVAQKRERLITVGIRNDLVTKIQFEFPKPYEYKPVLRDILESKVDSKYTLSDKLWTYLQNYAAKHREAGNGFGYGIAPPDGISRTMSARYYKDGSEILIEQKGKNPRRLTPRECARLQGFPDTFKIPVSDTQAYKQFGNSVVVPLMTEVAKLVVTRLVQLDDAQKTKKNFEGISQRQVI